MSVRYLVYKTPVPPNTQGDITSVGDAPDEDFLGQILIEADESIVVSPDQDFNMGGDAPGLITTWKYDETFDAITVTQITDLLQIEQDALTRRNALLEDVDYTLLRDVPLSAARRAEFIAYRQALRDLPDAGDWPLSSFPTAPAYEAYSEFQIQNEPILVELSQNTVASVPVPANCGFGTIQMVGSLGITFYSAQFVFDTNASVAALRVLLTPGGVTSEDLTTLTGTTGADNRVNLAINGGALAVESRRSGTRTLAITFSGCTDG